ncbi:MAG: amidase [Candidatus Dormiibacterota bacterium]
MPGWSYDWSGDVPSVESIVQEARLLGIALTGPEAGQLRPSLVTFFQGGREVASPSQKGPTIDFPPLVPHIPDASPADALRATQEVRGRKQGQGSTTLLPGAHLGSLSIAELSSHFRAQQLSPVTVTGNLLDSIRDHESHFNAWITILDGTALAEAKASEQRLLRGRPRSPIEGIPVVLKDNIDLAGVITTCGSVIMQKRKARRDAQIASALRKAGAVILGKANLLEFAYGVPNPHFGQTNNPWNVERTAGGSSGGCAAAVAAGDAFGGFGTDTGGSVRIPAAYCGIVGLKPTYKLLDTAGVFPLSHTADHLGLMGRSVQDVSILLSSVLQRDYALPHAQRDLKGLRIGILSSGSESSTALSVERVWHDALAVLRGAGATLEEVALPTVPSAPTVLQQIVVPEATRIHYRWLRTRAHDYADGTRMQLFLGLFGPGFLYLSAHDARYRIQHAWRQLLVNFDAVVNLTVPWIAPHHEPQFGSQQAASEANNTASQNLSGLPALTIPCGTDEQHMPVGMQITTGWYQEAKLLCIAQAAEKVLNFETLLGA